MKKVGYDLFSKFLMPQSIRVRGDEIYYVIKSVDLEENKYRYNLYKNIDSKSIKLTSKGDVKDFYLLSDGIYFISNREEKKIEEPKTYIYRLPYDGGEAELFLTLDYYVSDIKFINKNKFYFTADFNMTYENFLKKNKGNKKKAVELLKKEKDYQVIDEIPFYFNGAGFVNSHRSHLFYYDKGKITKLTKNVYEDVSLSSLDGEVLYYVSSIFKDKHTLYNKAYILESPLGKKKNITINDKFSTWLIANMPNDKLVYLEATYSKYGLNENPKLYIKGENDTIIFNSEGKYSFGNAALTDIVAEGREFGQDYLYKDDYIYFLTTIDDSSHLMGINLSTGEEKVISKVKGEITCVDFYKDGFVIAALREHGPELFYLDMNGNEKQLTKLNEKIFKDYYYQVPSDLTFVNSVGTEIKGWIIKPVDYDSKKKYPMVLDIHGGPKCAYGSHYFHEMQVWASKGYFVCYCNPTGGEGKGDEFANIYGHYGEQDYLDIMQFVDVVLEKYKNINKSKLCVTGGSYGGFMTNWIIGHTDRFCAAASQRSISNWISFYNTSDIGNDFTIDQIHGDPWNDLEKVWNHSPLKYAKNVKTPTLFIHSDEDYRCPLSEGMQMFYSIKDNGVDARMCIFHGENHELSRGGKPEHRIRRLKEITEWFESHI